MSTVVTEPAPGTETPAHAVTHRRAGISMLVIAVLSAVVFVLTLDGGDTASFVLSFRNDPVQLPVLELPAIVTVLVLSLLGAGVGAWALARGNRGAQTPLWMVALFAVLWISTFVVWAVANGRNTQQISLVGLLQGGLLLSMPLIFGAMAGVLSERAGVINIAIEGQLLLGAFAAAYVGSVAGQLYGVLAGAVAGLAIGALLALFALKYRVDQIVLGVVLNLLVIGLTGYAYSAFMTDDPTKTNSAGILDPIAIPLLSDIPVLGPVLFDHSFLIYLAYVAVIVVHVALFKTRWGLRARSVGEHPEAADTVGIRVNRVRMVNVLIGGAVAGLGGAFLVLGSVGKFSEEMSAGKGFIALAAVIFGRWTPIGAMIAALFFGFIDNLQSLLGIIGTPVPSEIMLMAPYIATILAVAGLVGKVRAPAADGQPYPNR